MKLFALLCFVGIASASLKPWRFQPGQEYHFSYEGRMMTGLPELATHYSGLGLRCQVELTVGEGNEYGITITNPEFTKINDRLESDGGALNDNWRRLKLPPFNNVPEEYTRHLRSPVVFKYGPTGEFKELMINQGEPNWSVNFKKALVALFQTRFDQGENLEQSLNLASDSNEIPTFWRTKEESLDGICDVSYQLNELPSYMIKEQPEQIPFPRSCPENSKFYELVKSRDVSSCSKRTSFVYYKPGFFRCSTGNCEGMWARSSNTKYVMCGQPGNLRIQKIENDGELQQNLFGFKTERFLTGTHQTLKLVQETSSKGRIVYPQNAINVNNLYYTYEFNRNGIASENNQQLLNNPVESQESNMLMETAKEGNVNPEKIIPQIKQLFRELVTEDLVKVQDNTEKQITLKALGLARGFSVLRKENIRNLYQELKGEFGSEEQKEVLKNIFFDTLVMGGTSSNILFVKEQIENGELTQTQAISFFTFLPHYVLAPTQILLKNLYELVTSEKVRQSEMLYNHAILSYTKLIEKACVADNRRTSYPTFVYGDFCNPESEIVNDRWIPYLQRELNNARQPERRNLLIVALGLMSHQNVISAVTPYVERTFEKTNEGASSNLTRFLAVYSLGNAGRKHPESVAPMLYSVFSNPSESTQVRIAAFHVLLRLNPSTFYLHKIATSTWGEKNLEVLQVVNTAYYTLAEQNNRDQSEVIDNSLAKKVWLVYPLMKRVVVSRFPTSATLYNNEYMRNLDVGYQGVTSWIASEDSVLPSDFYSRIVYYLDRYQFSPLEFAVRLRGGENLVQELIEILHEPQQYGKRTGDSYAKKIEAQLHSEWNKIIQKLQIRSRDGEETEGSLFINLFEDSPMFMSIHSSTIKKLGEKLNKILSSPKGLQQMVGEGNALNFQRMFDLSPSEFSIPSDMGFPIMVEVHMPVTVSVRGQINTQLQKESPSLQMEVKTLYAAQMIGWVGTIIPFTQEYVVTAVDEQTIFNIPADFSLDFSVREHKLNLKLRPFGVNGGQTDVFHFHIRPFTLAQQVWNLQPMTKSSQLKYIKSETPLRQKSWQFGDYIGLNLKSILNTESHFVDFRTILQKMKLFNYNPINMVRFGWAAGGLNSVGQPSFRRHEIKLRYDDSSSTTKEIEFQVQLNFVSKQRDEEEQLHQLESATDESLLPWKLSAKKIEGSDERHQTLKQLLAQEGIEEGNGMSVRFATILKGGSRQRTWTHTLNVMRGYEEVKEKWNLRLESDQQGNKICVNGEVEWPQVINSVWNLDALRASDFQIKYNNVIGFGSTCDESKITIRGTSRRSEKQNARSMESNEVQLYKRLQNQRTPLIELSQLAEQIREQATLLDEFEFDVQYENVPEKVMRIPAYLIDYIKTYYWPYLLNDKPEMNVGRRSNFLIQFNPDTKTFDLTITRGEQSKIRFQHIPLPYPLGYLFPLNGNHHGLSGMIEGIKNKVFSSPVCKVEGQWVSTFKNNSADLQVDDCFHLLSGDCSPSKRFAVLIRQKSAEESKEMKIFLKKNEIRLTPSQRHSRYASDIQIEVNGSEVQVSRGRNKEIRDKMTGESLAWVSRSYDGVVGIKSKWMDIKFDGYKATIKASEWIKNQLCGLCGNLNRKESAAFVGPDQCVYSRPETFAASYRIQTDECRTLPQQVQDELRKESQICEQLENIPTKVVKSFEAQSGPCTQHRHEILERHGKLCFSRVPVTECSQSCKPQSEESIVEKRVSFGCMKKDRVSERYAENVRQGQIRKELKNLPDEISVTIRQPKSCVPINQHQN